MLGLGLRPRELPASSEASPSRSTVFQAFLLQSLLPKSYEDHLLAIADGLGAWSTWCRAVFASLLLGPCRRCRLWQNWSHSRAQDWQISLALPDTLVLLWNCTRHTLAASLDHRASSWPCWPSLQGVCLLKQTVVEANEFSRDTACGGGISKGTWKRGSSLWPKTFCRLIESIRKLRTDSLWNQHLGQHNPHL